MNAEIEQGIIPLKGTENPERKLDVLFIHGLGGDARSTWTSANGSKAFWPDWLAEDFNDIGVWTIGYGATPSRWVDDVMAMEDRALNLLNYLSLKNIGDRPLLFIAHSLGGLITKHILDQAREHPKPEYKRVVDHLQGIIFLAVPHGGSGWADCLDAARSLVRGNQLIQQLQKDDAGLRRLSNSFIQIVEKHNLKCCCFFETKEVRVRKRFLGIPLGVKGIQIVSESSARGHFPQETPIGLDDDHISICKLESRNEQLYGNVCRFIERLLPSSLNSINESQTATNKPEKIQVSRLPHTNAGLFGRETELELLDEAWSNSETNILILKAMGGTGKTALMKHWLDDLATDHFRGANAVYTWSFYLQGTAEDKQASADEFFETTLRWFGYQGDPPPSAHDKGLKLAELVNNQRTLLILDGLEPLQYPEGGAMDGMLRDQGLTALLQQLAAQNQGLLLISSRQAVIELQDKPKPRVIHHDLENLSISAGRQLFKAAQITGTDQEFEDTVDEYNGHALSLNLLATYLSNYEDRDIKQRSNLSALTDFPEPHRDSHHAFKVMAAYEQQLQDTTELSILYMMGLFDRPVSGPAIQHLRKVHIAHIADAASNENVFNAAVKRLRAQQLLNTENPESSSANSKDSLDSHPLVREYFGKRLQQQFPDAWRQAHQTLYDYYKSVPNHYQPETLSEMEPLFAAVTHGCAAGLHQQALNEVYWPRINRENEHYLCNKLGAYGADLSAIAQFFEEHWHTPAAGLSDDDKAFLLNAAATRLRALGRLQEAGQPMKAGLEMQIKQENWKLAAVNASNLSELQLTRGVISTGDNSAIKVAEHSVQLADKSGDAFERISNRTTLADALHQACELASAQALFTEAETLQQQWQSEYSQLYSLRGYRYCDLLLSSRQWRDVQARAKQSIKIAQRNKWLLDIALDQLSLGRASLQQAITEAMPNHQDPIVGRVSDSVTRQQPVLPSEFVVLRTANTTYDDIAMQSAKDWLDQAVDGLRKAGTEHHLPRGLLARARYQRWFLVLGIKPTTDIDSTISLPQAQQDALADLQETHDIAQRAGMRLHLTDYHLECTRMALTIEQPVHDLTACDHLAQAKTLIEQTGYNRRLPEVEYLEDILSTPD